MDEVPSIIVACTRLDEDVQTKKNKSVHCCAMSSCMNKDIYCMGFTLRKEVDHFGLRKCMLCKKFACGILCVAAHIKREGPDHEGHEWSQRFLMLPQVQEVVDARRSLLKGNTRPEGFQKRFEHPFQQGPALAPLHPLPAAFVPSPFPSQQQQQEQPLKRIKLNSVHDTPPPQIHEPAVRQPQPQNVSRLKLTAKGRARILLSLVRLPSEDLKTALWEKRKSFSILMNKARKIFPSSNQIDMLASLLNRKGPLELAVSSPPVVQGSGTVTGDDMNDSGDARPSTSDGPPPTWRHVPAPFSRTETLLPKTRSRNLNTLAHLPFEELKETVLENKKAFMILVDKALALFPASCKKGSSTRKTAVSSLKSVIPPRKTTILASLGLHTGGQPVNTGGSLGLQTGGQPVNTDGSLAPKIQGRKFMRLSGKGDPSDDQIDAARGPFKARVMMATRAPMDTRCQDAPVTWPARPFADTNITRGPFTLPPQQAPAVQQESHLQQQQQLQGQQQSLKEPLQPPHVPSRPWQWHEEQTQKQVLSEQEQQPTLLHQQQQQQDVLFQRQQQPSPPPQQQQQSLPTPQLRQQQLQWLSSQPQKSQQRELQSQQQQFDEALQREELLPRQQQPSASPQPQQQQEQVQPAVPLQQQRQSPPPALQPQQRRSPSHQQSLQPQQQQEQQQSLPSHMQQQLEQQQSQPSHIQQQQQHGTPSHQQSQQPPPQQQLLPSQTQQQQHVTPLHQQSQQPPPQQQQQQSLPSQVQQQSGTPSQQQQEQLLPTQQQRLDTLSNLERQHMETKHVNQEPSLEQLQHRQQQPKIKQEQTFLPASPQHTQQQQQPQEPAQVQQRLQQQQLEQQPSQGGVTTGAGMRSDDARATNHEVQDDSPACQMDEDDGKRRVLPMPVSEIGSVPVFLAYLKRVKVDDRRRAMLIKALKEGSIPADLWELVEWMTSEEGLNLAELPVGSFMTAFAAGPRVIPAREFIRLFELHGLRPAIGDDPEPLMPQVQRSQAHQQQQPLSQQQQHHHQPLPQQQQQQQQQQLQPPPVAQQKRQPPEQQHVEYVDLLDSDDDDAPALHVASPTHAVHGIDRGSAPGVHNLPSSQGAPGHSHGNGNGHESGSGGHAGTSALQGPRTLQSTPETVVLPPPGYALLSDRTMVPYKS